jgi:hypothetical protein
MSESRRKQIEEAAKKAHDMIDDQLALKWEYVAAWTNGAKWSDQHPAESGSVIQEIVSDGNLFITRIKVEGGWVYNSYDKGHGILGSCFVPEVEKIIVTTPHQVLEETK